MILGIVSPCYNESAVLPETARRLTQLLQELEAEGRVESGSFVLFVDDGSTDTTWPLIRRLYRENPYVLGLSLSANAGHQNALLAGLMTARGMADAVVSVDADLQDDLSVIARMVEERREYVEQSLQAAKEANDQLAQVKSQSEALLQSAREQQMKILNEASATRDRIVAEAKAQAQAETQRQIEDAKRQIRLEQDAAIRAARSEIALLAVDIAQKVIREKLDNTPAQMSMIDRLLDEAPVMKGDTKIQ